MSDGANNELRDGRYVILRQLGEGRQGDTVQALDKSAGRLVAIKRFDVRGAKSWKDVELAERETRVLASLSHPALPAYIEHFEQDGALFLVMELIEGESLRSVVRRAGRLPEGEVVQFLRESAAILEYLHGHSPPVIHRDINPKNVLRRPNGSFAFVDFGAVRDGVKPEGGSTVVGTFGYMAPEQFQGRALPASDVYAVGATALALLTGAEPETLPHQGLRLDVQNALGRKANPQLVHALRSMLDPDPDRRATRIDPLLSSFQDTRFSRSGTDAWAGVGTGKRESGRSRHERRAERRWERRRARREMRWTRSRTGLPRPLVFLLLVVVLVTQIVATVLLRGVLPILLQLLSVIFGRPLRDLAERSERFSHDVHLALSHFRLLLLGRSEESDIRATDTAAESRPPYRVRIAPPNSVETVESATEEEPSRRGRDRTGR